MRVRINLEEEAARMMFGKLPKMTLGKAKTGRAVRVPFSYQYFQITIVRC